MIDVIIIGGGVAGMTACLNILRSGKTCKIIESNGIGGQIAISPRVENFPTYGEISGAELSDKLFDQITEWGADIELEKVVSIDKNNDIFTVTTDFSEYQCKSIIIATGVHHKKINLPREDELMGKGLSYCALCDGAFFKGENVAVVGDGNSAMQYAVLMSNYCPKVYILTWFDKFFGDKALEKTLRSKENIIIMPNTSVFGFVGENELSGLKYKGREDNIEDTLEVKGAFIAIGQVPSNEPFANLVELDKFGYIVADEECRTSCEGVFVAGDCRTKSIRQIVTAVADGAVASFNACAYLEGV